MHIQTPEKKVTVVILAPEKIQWSQAEKAYLENTAKEIFPGFGVSIDIRTTPPENLSDEASATFVVASVFRKASRAYFQFLKANRHNPQVFFYAERKLLKKILENAGTENFRVKLLEQGGPYASCIRFALQTLWNSSLTA
ncbi:MAG TPA: hypothetical protein VF817_00660 [Patescibacteria group bacterium]